MDTDDESVADTGILEPLSLSPSEQRPERCAAPAVASDQYYSSLRRMLLNWDNPPQSLFEVLPQLLDALASSETDKYRLAKMLYQVRPEDRSDYRHRAFWTQLRDFCWLYLNISRWLRQFERADNHTDLTPPYVPALARKSDSAEAGWNALRTFCVIFLGSAFWITTQWDAGDPAMTLAAISCVLYSSSPSPVSSASLLLRTLLLLSLFSFVMKFGFMIQVTVLWQFLIVLFPLLLTMQLFKLQQKKRAALWGQLIVFMGSFLAVTNPATYDYQGFINDNLAKVCGVALVWLAFNILRPSSDKRRSQRHIRALRREFVDQLGRHPHLNQNAFESLVYHRINQLKDSRDDQASLWLMRWGVVLLNCSQIAWTLRNWKTPSSALAETRDAVLRDLQSMISDRDAHHVSLNEILRTLQQRINLLHKRGEAQETELAGIIWRLYCALSRLKTVKM